MSSIDHYIPKGTFLKWFVDGQRREGSPALWELNVKSGGIASRGLKHAGSDKDLYAAEDVDLEPKWQQLDAAGAEFARLMNTCGDQDLAGYAAALAPAVAAVANRSPDRIAYFLDALRANPSSSWTTGSPELNALQAVVYFGLVAASEWAAAFCDDYVETTVYRRSSQSNVGFVVGDRPVKLEGSDGSRLELSHLFDSLDADDLAVGNHNLLTMEMPISRDTFVKFESLPVSSGCVQSIVADEATVRSKNAETVQRSAEKAWAGKRSDFCTPTDH